MRAPFTRTALNRTALARLIFVGLTLTLGLSACGEPDATRDNLMAMLTERAELDETQATCITDEIFAEGRFSQDEINTGSRRPAEVPGFQDAIDDAIADCNIGGPQSDTPDTAGDADGEQ